jgi:hypothetical protein
MKLRIIPKPLLVLAVAVLSVPVYAEVGNGDFAGKWTGSCQSDGRSVQIEKNISQFKGLPELIYLTSFADPRRMIKATVGQLTSDVESRVSTTTVATWSQDKTNLFIQVSLVRNTLQSVFYEISIKLDGKGNLIWDQKYFESGEDFVKHTVVCELQKTN